MLELKKVKLDEIELYLELMRNNHSEDIRYATYKEIADLIQINFGIVCREEDISLLHEPTIDQDQLDLEIHMNTLGYYG